MARGNALETTQNHLGLEWDGLGVLVISEGAEPGYGHLLLVHFLDQRRRAVGTG